MPEFLGITKASTRCTGGSAARRRRPAGCRWGSPSAWGGHHGFERGRQLAALSPNRPALRGLPAWPEAPKKPARLDQEHRQPSSDGEGTVVPPQPGNPSTASPETTEAHRAPKARSNAGAGPQKSSMALSPRREVRSWWLGCAFSSRRETGPGRPGRRLPHRYCSPQKCHRRTCAGGAGAARSWRSCS